MMILKFIRKHIVLIVCVVIVAASGYALAASNQLENPFNAISGVTRLIASDTSAAGDQNFDNAGNINAGGSTDRPAPPDGGFRGGDGGGEGGTGIQWNQLGSVAFNLWFITAATVVMAVIGPLIGWAFKRLRPAKRKAVLSPASG